MIDIKTKNKRHLSIVCSSDFEHLDRIVDETQHFLAGVVSDDELSYQIVLLLTEAVTNAIEHGNELDANKQVHVELEIDGNRVHMCVEDQGEGFDPASVKDPLNEENLFNDGGRGIFFIENMADKVWYENGGRCVHIEFHRPTT